MRKNEIYLHYTVQKKKEKLKLKNKLKLNYICIAL